MSDEIKLKINTGAIVSAVIFLFTTVFASGVAVHKLDTIIEQNIKQEKFNEKIDQRVSRLERFMNVDGDDIRKYQGYKDAQ